VSSKEELKDFFDERVQGWARHYSDPNRRTYLVSRARFALQMLEASVAPGATILDVG
jgi:hypothetical protein